MSQLIQANLNRNRRRPLLVPAIVHRVCRCKDNITLDYTTGLRLQGALMSRYTRFTLSALVDAFPLAAQRFDPPPDVPVRAAVVISCATGIHAGFYRDFSLYAMLFQ